MSGYSDQVLRYWAADHLKLPRERVAEAVLFYSEGDGCGCCGDPPHANLTVMVVGYSRAPRTRVREIDVLAILGRFVEGMIEITQEVTP